VVALARANLGFPFDRLLALTRDPAGWVLFDRGGSLVGVMLTRQLQQGARRYGIASWIVMDRSGGDLASGRRIQALAAHALADQPSAGWTHIVTTDTDAYNSPVWRFDRSLGLRRWPPSWQLAELGWRWPVLMFQLRHFGVRTFILRMSVDGSPLPEPTSRGALSLLGATLFMGALLSPLASSAPWTVASSAWGAVALLAFVAARGLGHALVARRVGLTLAFRFWDSGLLLAACLAALGLVLPGVGGGLYVHDEDHDYLADPGPFGRVMAAGALASLLLLGAVALGAHGALLPEALTRPALAAGLGFGATDTLLGFGPARAMPAGHVWAWSPVAGWLLGALFVALVWAA